MADVYVLEHGKTLPPDQWEREGKPQWRSYLTVETDRFKAWDLVESIMQQLRALEADPSRGPVRLNLYGELSKLAE
jgi:hypothetical protein